MVEDPIIRMFEMEEDQTEFPSKYAGFPYEAPAGTRSSAKRIGGRSAVAWIRTKGAVAKGATRAWVYVARTKRGHVKVGITSDVDGRMASLHASCVASFLVLPEVARDIETDALRRLRRFRGDGEWVPVSAEEASTAVAEAVDAMRRCRHVDPDLTADEARRLRISLALGSALI